MSLIGKEVQAQVYNSNGVEIIQGTVIDKYLGVNPDAVGIDYYIIRSPNSVELEHVPCSSIIQVAPNAQ